MKTLLEIADKAGISRVTVRQRIESLGMAELGKMEIVVNRAVFMYPDSVCDAVCKYQRKKPGRKRKS